MAETHNGGTTLHGTSQRNTDETSLGETKHRHIKVEGVLDPVND